MLIDSHAHLETLDKLESALNGAIKNGVSKIITIGTDLESSKNASNLALSCSRPGLDVWASAGIHPGDGQGDVEKLGIAESVKMLGEIIGSGNKIIAVGECGLDFYKRNDKTPKTNDLEKDYQFALFKAQIELANKFDLPLIVHCRNAWREIFQLISDLKFPISKFKGVFHSFTGGVDEAKKAIELGFYISFSGIVTFKNAEKIQEAAKWVPGDKFLIETDSVYLTPEPIRGQKNSPENVRIIATFLSKLRNTSFEAICDKSSENTRRLFSI